MGRSQETYNKKEIRNKKEKKRKEKEQKRLDRRDSDKSGSFEDMIAYVDENGMITSTPPDPERKNVIKTEDIEISTPRLEDIPFDPEKKGTVTFYNENKGFGFIRESETQMSVFVHVNQLLEPIKEGNLVSFIIEKGVKGPTATQVKLIR
jgi:cold shock CspA family protein